MKKIFFRLFVLFVLVGIINIAIRFLIYQNDQPFYWASPVASEKREFLLENKGNFNTIFVGSSKTYHQVNPLLFDSLNAGQKTRSFNFGVQGMLPPESFEIYRNLIENDSLRFKYAFLELDWIGTVTYENLHVWRSFYWLDLAKLKFMAKSYYTSQMPLHLKIWTALSRVMNYLEKIYNFGFLPEYFKYASKQDRNSKLRKFIVDYHGYEPVDSQEKFNPAELAKLRDVKNASEKSFKRHYSGKSNYVNQAYLDELNSLIAMSEARGIHLIFVIPPQWKTYQYNELIPLTKALDKSHFIEMADANKYPEFFKAANMFDADHLNYKGAVLYTEELFKNFKEI